MWTVTDQPRANTTSPERTCVGCRGTFARGALLRLSVVDVAPYVVPDATGKLGGRGAWVCARRACVRTAVRKGGLARAARHKVDVDEAGLAALLADQLRRRAEGLLASAARSRRVAIGTDAVELAIRGATAKLLVLARDGAGKRDDLDAAARRVGLPRTVFGTKSSLGQLFGRAEVSVLAVLDEGIAAELERAAEQVTALSEDE